MLRQQLRQLFRRVQAVADRPQLEVLHDAITPQATLDFGAPGDSSGDMRLFSFSGSSADGRSVTMDWVMTTTGPSQQITGAERRTTSGNFAFGTQETDQLVIQGIGLYASGESTFTSGRSLVRMITGGMGRYAGATGQVLSQHDEDNTWSHTFYLESPQLKGVPEELNYRIGNSGPDRFMLDRQQEQPFDVVVNFSVNDGDRLELRRSTGNASGFKAVTGRQGVRKQLSSQTLVIYDESTGGLYLNANGRNDGFGHNGGLLAVMDAQPQLTAEAFIGL